MDTGRLTRLSAALELLSARIETEAREPVCAVAIRKRFGGALAEILATRDAVAERRAQWTPDHTDLAALELALGRLHDVVASLPVAAAADVPSMSRAAQRRLRQRAVRLEDSARRMLKRVTLTLAAGLAASTLAALPAAAQTVIHDTGALSSANHSASGNTILNVDNLTQNITPASGAVSLAGSGGGGANQSAAHYTCSTAGECDIVQHTNADGTPAADTCTVHSGSSATCVVNTPASGPTGASGPQLTVNVSTGAFKVAPGNVDGAFGVVARSTGGNGGNGGDAYVAGNGGDGGDGVDGGTVTVNVNGRVETQGDNAAGVAAFSTGGNGGNGGGSYGLGGHGGDGGAAGFGGSATANLTGGSVETQGDRSFGVGAVSQGGNGGHGGGGGGLVFSPGGGSSAGAGGTASVNTAAGTTIETHGAYSHGVVGQSIGGGGGGSSGGFGLFYSGGGSGGTGGNGGNVFIDTRGTIVTHGDNAQGILAQSIGGGGGDGASNAGLVALGSSGGPGGQGGTVSVTNSGSITTEGKTANAIEAQSIGGGGGNGGSSGGAVALGGDGSGTTKGGTVSVSNSGSLTTLKAESSGIFAQSIGGGGGDGGHSGGLFAAGGKGGSGADGAAVTVTNSGDIDAGTNGSSSINSFGIFAQSIGGGGGNGGGAVAAGLGFAAAFGGSGGVGGDGKDVSIKLDNVDASLADGYSITTHGDQSTAVFAQSVGGGGGHGGFAVAGAVGTVGVSFGAGGSGGGGGSAGNVSVATKGTLTTYGANSSGVFAQSLGGSGGAGGFAITMAGGSFAAAVSMGGSGGAGGSAGTVDVLSLSNVETTGNNSAGLVAESVGGGGGDGGFAVSGVIGGVGLNASIGGSGANGGTGDDVTVTSSGSIHTRGDNSDGIFAQSVGGGGGNGGFSVAGSISGGGASVGLGGSGGGGQSAGDVTVTADGGGQNLGSGWTLVTEGTNSTGIFAQSVGGGGGNGGFAGSLALSGSVSAGVSLGGNGSTGGNAGKVKVASGTASAHQNILTQDDNSTGILAQSIGGGGGDGGFAVALSGSAPILAPVGSASVSLGGSGATGGRGGDAQVDSIGDIKTMGDLSDGILVQSVGGGGGNGGFSIAGAFSGGMGGAAVALGGAGGTGNSAGNVILNSTGDIETHGAQSVGLMAQSVGGGGGNGGFAGAASLTLDGVSASVGVGGGSGTGGDAGTVDVNNTGSIYTYGDNATGLLAQSVGGGGGNGGSAVGLAVGSLGGASVALGRTGGSGGDGAAVDVISDGNIVTGAGYHSGDRGGNAIGILAQSVGGGGGNGGFAGSLNVGGVAAVGVTLGGGGGGGGDGGTVELEGTGVISTAFNNSAGILAQSVGGGGGNGGFSVAVSGSGAIEQAGAAASVALGGSGGAGGDGSKVLVDYTGQIYTQGDFSAGVIAQSVGGGGGNGGFAVAGAFTAGVAGIGVALGGTGDSGGIGGEVQLTSTGTSAVYDAGFATIATQGVNSIGVLAQSVGGGGGNGGFAGTAGASLQGVGIGVGLGGSGAAGGKGGKVTLTSTNNILTMGADSSAVVGQSVGGGGGTGGFVISASGGKVASASFGLGGKGGAGGDGGQVTVTNTGDILTTSERSYGVVAQSVGGGGGTGGFSIAGDFTVGKVGISVSLGGSGGIGGKGGQVDLTETGNVFTQGDTSIGVLAQSVGGGGGAGGFAGALAINPDGAAIGFSLGGAALDGGDAGKVNLTYNGGLVHTKGVGAIGVLAQSVGGGGGVGGFAASGGASNGLDLVGAMGGKSSAGGDGGDVTMNATVDVLTTGAFSHGVMAQSLGGGGGVGSFAVAGALSADSKAIGVGIGSDGGSGGKAGKVNLTHTGAVETDGEDSKGVLAQSIGGGGGDGGFSVSFSASAKDVSAGGSVGGKAGGAGQTGGEVVLDNTGSVLTKGDDSVGVMAQSVGGGGGDGHWGASVAGGKGFQWGFAMGGNGGDGATASTVSLSQSGDVQTNGAFAYGLLAQSVGGGGGNGGFSVSATGGTGATLNFSWGGDGGAGGGADDVTLKLRGNVETFGEGANAVMAQSVGGGGGSGGFSGALAVSTGGKGAANVSLGGTGGSGNTSGAVSVDSQGGIWTHGDHAAGILAQSVGGGGGAGGASVTATGALQTSVGVSVGGFGGDGGTADTVDVKQVGDIWTTGERSYGILAQSVGGGGGAGGFSITGSMSTEGSDVAASIGGFGGSGNWAGSVSVDYAGMLETDGAGAHGIFAQSVGGGGGAGGFSGAASLTLESGKSLTLSMGGFGGDGGSADDVDVTVGAGQILTKGVGAYGVLAQSIGGGGGDGGFSFAADIGIGNGVGLTASLGGFGGSGNIGRDVDVQNSSNIFTLGETSTGIFAQSLGGGGGSGGFSASGALQTGPGSKQAVVAVGGFGGTGADSGAVVVGNHGQIVTAGSHSDGITAQSVGGGGGDGGMAFTGAFGGADTKQISVAVGGFGAEAGNGGTVDVTNSGLIQTGGVQSDGIFAQSVGGGGGRGGFAVAGAFSLGGEGNTANIATSVGGFGGAGGTSAQVNVTNSGQITTTGEGSVGVFAQSVGGGGGVGGGAFTGIVALSTSDPTTAANRTFNVAVSIGGGGGDGNDAGGVMVDNSGRIDTFGNDAGGIVAQSIGGGGGIGGSNNAVNLNVGAFCTPGDDVCSKNNKTPRAFNGTVVVGGSGGGASDGNVVNVKNSGTIVTRGADSDGIFAQSVGGGGGAGGNGTLGFGDYLPGATAAIPLGLVPFDQTKLYTDISVAVGGSGGSSGFGALVKVDNSGTIVTLGDRSAGIFAQSIGGGGGVGGKGASGATGKVGIGGSGGSSGDGGEVDVANSGSIETFGTSSYGIFAQSVGGGGGLAGGVDRALANKIDVGGLQVGNYGVGLAFGQNGGGGGDGGDVTVVNTGAIATHGAGAVGIFAQSVGGGGGALGTLGNFDSAWALSFVGSTGDAGSAGNVTVTQTGDIVTTGGAHAIFAQSVGGQGKGGDVTVNYGGNITVYGDYDAVVAQSTGLGGAGNVQINFLTGTSIIGGAGAMGVHLYDGVDNVVNSNATVMSFDGIDGMAFGGSGNGADVINNNGLVIGNIALGAGANALNTRFGAFYLSGHILDLGDGNTFSNSGYYAPGGDGLVYTTNETGNFLQGATGNYTSDLDLKQTGKANEADRLNVSGDAVVGGQITALIDNKAWALPGDHAITILHAAGGQTHAGLTLEAPVSAIAKFDLRYPDGNTIQLGYNIDYSPAGLNRNETSVGDHINSIQLNGGTDAFRTITGPLFDVPDNAHLAAIYDRLTQEPFVDNVSTTANSGRRFTDNLFSCAPLPGTTSPMDAPRCGWVRADSHDIRIDKTSETLGFHDTGSALQAGIEVPVGGKLRLGVSLAKEWSDMAVGTEYARLHGTRTHYGAVAKTRAWDWDFALAVAGGSNNFDSTRLVNFPTAPLTATAEQGGGYFMADVRASRFLGGAGLWWRPGLEILGGSVHTDAFHETGAGPLDLNVAARDNDFWRAKAGFETGGEFRLDANTVLRSTLSLGVSQRMAGEDWGLSAAFEGAPSGATPFLITSPTDRTLGEVSAGVAVVNSKGVAAKVGYVGQFGDTTRQSGVNVKLVLPF